LLVETGQTGPNELAVIILTFNEERHGN
jgi:hypothetical protein